MNTKELQEVIRDVILTRIIERDEPVDSEDLVLGESTELTDFFLNFDFELSLKEKDAVFESGQEISTIYEAKFVPTGEKLYFKVVGYYQSLTGVQFKEWYFVNREVRHKVSFYTPTETEDKEKALKEKVRQAFEIIQIEEDEEIFLALLTGDYKDVELYLEKHNLYLTPVEKVGDMDQGTFAEAIYKITDGSKAETFLRVVGSYQSYYGYEVGSWGFAYPRKTVAYEYITQEVHVL